MSHASKMPACGRRSSHPGCFLPQIHWFSIINSCVTVLLLTGFLATILMRVLKNDFLKYSRDDDGARLGMHADALRHGGPMQRCAGPCRSWNASHWRC